jgi:hypothetical protein
MFPNIGNIINIRSHQKNLNGSLFKKFSQLMIDLSKTTIFISPYKCWICVQKKNKPSKKKHAELCFINERNGREWPLMHIWKYCRQWNYLVKESEIYINKGCIFNKFLYICLVNRRRKIFLFSIQFIC